MLWRMASARREGRRKSTKADLSSSSLLHSIDAGLMQDGVTRVRASGALSHPLASERGGATSSRSSSWLVGLVEARRLSRQQHGARSPLSPPCARCDHRTLHITPTVPSVSPSDLMALTLAAKRSSSSRQAWRQPAAATAAEAAASAAAAARLRCRRLLRAPVVDAGHSRAATPQESRSCTPQAAAHTHTTHTQHLTAQAGRCCACAQPVLSAESGVQHHLRLSNLTFSIQLAHNTTLVTQAGR